MVLSRGTRLANAGGLAMLSTTDGNRVALTTQIGGGGAGMS
ncbi:MULTISPECIES: hypothetical protein [Streptomyces]|nr:hypothetical protein [Streptomyces sp. NEAU-383]